MVAFTKRSRYQSPGASICSVLGTDDGSETTETSLVRICEPNGPGVVPVPGIVPRKLVVQKTTVPANGNTLFDVAG